MYPSPQCFGSGSGAFLSSGSGIRIQDKFFSDPGSFWLWLRLRLCSWKHMKQEKSKFAFQFSCRIRDPGWKKVWIWIRDEKTVGSGSGMKHPVSATLLSWHLIWKCKLQLRRRMPRRQYSSGTGILMSIKEYRYRTGTETSWALSHVTIDIEELWQKDGNEREK
jgi:hypothetical protein